MTTAEMTSTTDLILAPSLTLSDPQVLQDALESIKLAKSCTNLLLSRIVYEAHHNDLWKQWPDAYDTFEEWGLAVLEKKKSMLYSLSKTWEVWVVKHNSSIDRLKKIDFSKLSVATPFVNDKNADEILGLCERNNLYQLQKILRSSNELKNLENEEAKTKKFTFEVTALASDTVSDALDAVRELANTEIPGKMLEYLCASFLCGDGLMTKEQHLESCVNALELAFNVEIEVRPKTEEIVEGKISE
jgi:hypothetical protein